MSKWYYKDDPEQGQISTENYLLRVRIENILTEYTQEMEGYSYCGSNPGIAEDNYEDVAESIMTELGLWKSE